jgi:hypothetical protein
VQHPQDLLIVRYKRGKVYLRVIAGWPLSTYGIKEGSELNVEML